MILQRRYIITVAGSARIDTPEAMPATLNNICKPEEAISSPKTFSMVNVHSLQVVKILCQLQRIHLTFATAGRFRNTVERINLLFGQ